MRTLVCALTAIILVSVLLLCPFAHARTQVSFVDGVFFFETFIQIYGFYASEELAAKWEGWINELWDAASADDSCYPMHFRATVKYAGETIYSVDEGWEAWYVHPVAPGGYYRSYVSGIGPSATGGSGSIASNSTRRTIVHEAGHVFGHPDMYDRNDRPFVGWRGNIMASFLSDISMVLDPLAGFDWRNFEILAEAAMEQMGIDIPGCIQFYLTIDLLSDEPSHCNRDRLKSELLFKVSPAGYSGSNWSLKGFGTGTLRWQTVSRCPGTQYGGIRPVKDPFHVSVSGYIDDTGHHLKVMPADENETFYTNGEVYSRGPTLPHLFEYSTGKFAPGGSLQDFILPPNIQMGDRYVFEIADPREDGWWYTGVATLEVLSTTK